MRCYNCDNSRIRKTEHDYTCLNMPRCLMHDVELREKHAAYNIEVGSRIRFKKEKRFWKVVLRDERFIIAVWRKYYTICDLEECIRGADNYGGYYDYRELSDIEKRECLYKLHMREDAPISSLKDLPEDIKKKQIEEINAFGEVPVEHQWMDNLEISYRNWCVLNIEEVK